MQNFLDTRAYRRRISGGAHTLHKGNRHTPYLTTLHTLLAQSASSRTFFVSLPVALQTKLHEYDAYIHSAAQLRQTAQQVYRCECLAVLGGWRTTERNDRRPRP